MTLPVTPRVFKTSSIVTLAVLATLASGFAAAGEVADADAARKKPLQRCDQLSDKAEIACLQKAREGIVAARKKRETSAGAAKASTAPAAPVK
jgi:hypothetical protein